MEYEFYHHGIKGQRWGVRRFQNEDGSYTQAGLKRYNRSKEGYDSANASYKNAKKQYKSGNISKEEFQKSAQERKKAKRQLNADYRQLGRDQRADKGKALYAEGKTIKGNNKKRDLVTGLVSAAAIIGGTAALGHGIKFSQKFGNTSVAGIINTSGVIVTAALIANLAYDAKTNAENSKLRAYYGHSRKKVE